MLDKKLPTSMKFIKRDETLQNITKLRWKWVDTGDGYFSLDDE